MIIVIVYAVVAVILLKAAAGPIRQVCELILSLLYSVLCEKKLFLPRPLRGLFGLCVTSSVLTG